MNHAAGRRRALRAGVQAAVRAAALLLLSAGGVVAQAFAACPLPSDAGSVLSDGEVQAAWAVVDAPAIAVGTHFVLGVRACPATAELVRVDATMPAHRHGMNYRPSIVATGAGAWRVEGLMFHMRGGWELVLELRHGGRMHRLRQAIELP